MMGSRVINLQGQNMGRYQHNGPSLLVQCTESSQFEQESCHCRRQNYDMQIVFDPSFPFSSIQRLCQLSMLCTVETEVVYKYMCSGGRVMGEARGVLTSLMDVSDPRHRPS